MLGRAGAPVPAVIDTASSTSGSWLQAASWGLMWRSKARCPIAASHITSSLPSPDPSEQEDRVLDIVTLGDIGMPHWGGNKVYLQWGGKPVTKLNQGRVPVCEGCD